MNINPREAIKVDMIVVYVHLESKLCEKQSEEGKFWPQTGLDYLSRSGSRSRSKSSNISRSLPDLPLPPYTLTVVSVLSLHLGSLHTVREPTLLTFLLTWRYSLK